MRAVNITLIAASALFILGSVAAAPLANRAHDWHPDIWTIIAPGVAEQLGGSQ